MKSAARIRRGSPSRRQREGGYAILLVLFLATLVLLATMTVAPNLLTEGRREKEKEMIWRGQQYSRGIKLFYRKNGKFPTTMDDLIKPKIGNLRFMRQAYKDPMNTKDGEWRLIYVGPQGQLIGSLKRPQTIQLAGLGSPAVPGTPAGQVAAQSAGQGFGQTSGPGFGNSSAATPPAQPGGSADQPNSGQPNPSGSPAGSQGADSSSPGATGDATNAPDAADEALLASDPTTIIGGNIIGVGSKINRASIIVYDKAKNYKQFEFIWDPSKDRIAVGAAPQIGTPAGSQIGTPAGSPSNFNPNSPNSPSSPLNPQAGPPETAPPPQ